ncbi:PP2C family protein-serine/threonine phosphatase [Streptomyces sp. NPDC058459]|uniref:PP2C family protein-serine/threonine phosphatase n=1 Tax=Streptomyces sp. NPDC058459 TaxID=3346508 RepID=UPI0036513AC0
MSEPEIDYEAVFSSLPGAVALVTPQLSYADANPEFVRLRGLAREQLVGRFLPDDLPGKDPAEPLLLRILASLRRVADTGRPNTVDLQRYDLEDPDRPGLWHERYWNMTDVPIFGSDGRLALLMHRMEDVTELIRAREVALTLQEAMLPAPRPVGGHLAAVRYRPAAEALHVAGDWYDLIELPDGRSAVAVGDVVGHGLPAAAVMGQLRSALTASSLTAKSPAHALEVLELYARTVDGAENTTVAMIFIDWDTHTITYSTAGHPPPALLQSDGTVTFLDDATDPPLGAPLHGAPRIHAVTEFQEGAVLVLYTDGLVERRREDIDVGIARLSDSLTRHRTAEPETLADAVLDDLLPPDGASDDTALVIVRL